MRNFAKILILITVLVINLPAFGREYRVNSRDNKISICVYTDSDLSWSAYLNGRAVMEGCPVALELSGGVTLGENIRIVKSEESSVGRQIIPELPRKKAIINDTYNELSIMLFSGCMTMELHTVLKLLLKII